MFGSLLARAAEAGNGRSSDIPRDPPSLFGHTRATGDTKKGKGNYVLEQNTVQDTLQKR